jgi:hypothetical protein
MTAVSATIETNATKAEQACLNYLKSRVSWGWPGASRAVRGVLKDEVAQTLSSEASSTRASTDLYNWRHPALAALRAFKRQVRDWWFSRTIAWTEDGVRLLPKGKVEEFEAELGARREELAGLAQAAQEARYEIVQEARARRGKAFSEADYPADLSGLFALEWGYESLTVSPELAEISRGAYAAEQVRQMARVLGAVQLAEQAQLDRLSELVGRLLHTLTPPDEEEGRRRPIYSAAVDQLRDFCSEFSGLILWGCDDVQEVVAEAGSVIAGLDADDLRRNAELRQEVSGKLAEIARQLPAVADPKQDD